MDRQFDRPAWSDPLDGAPVDMHERRAEHRVTRHDQFDAFSQRRYIEIAAQPHCPRDVMECSVWYELFHEPHPLLGKRKSKLRATVHEDLSSGTNLVA